MYLFQITLINWELHKRNFKLCVSVLSYKLCVCKRNFKLFLIFLFLSCNLIKMYDIFILMHFQVIFYSVMIIKAGNFFFLTSVHNTHIMTDKNLILSYHSTYYLYIHTTLWKYGSAMFVDLVKTCEFHIAIRNNPCIM